MTINRKKLFFALTTKGKMTDKTLIT